MRANQRWQDRVNLVLGLWLFLSPFFGIGAGSTPAVWHSYIFGATVALVSLGALAKPQMWEEWTNLCIGLWLIAAPYALGFSTVQVATWNHLIVGIVVAAGALWAAVLPGTPRMRHV